MNALFLFRTWINTRMLEEHTRHALNSCVPRSFRGSGKNILYPFKYFNPRWLVGELSASLNMEEGGGIANNLQRLYEYIQFELTQANLKNELGRLVGPIRCMSLLREAWQELAVQEAKSKAMGL